MQDLPIKFVIIEVFLLVTTAGESAPEEYIVVFENDAEQQFNDLFSTIRAGSITGVQLQHCNTSVVGPVDADECPGSINLIDFKGIVIALAQSAVDGISIYAGVQYVEKSVIMETSSCAWDNSTIWNLDHLNSGIDDKRYLYHNVTGADVYVYVLDTGINIQHSDFKGRALWGKTFVGTDGKDVHGHGTHVAGTVLSDNVGVVRSDMARVVSVKVLGDNGGGASTAVMSGIYWAHSDGLKNNKRAIINLSLSGSASVALDAVVASVVRLNTVAVAAAGNDDVDACSRSPAREPLAITVACHDANNQRCSFSNWGSCVDIFAPGRDILSLSTHFGTETKSGTSMSAPHVAGSIVSLLHDLPCASPCDVLMILLSEALKCHVKDSKESSNLMLQLFCPTPFSCPLVLTPLTCEVMDYPKPVCDAATLTTGLALQLVLTMIVNLHVM